MEENRVRKTFDTVSTGYDKPALRFFATSAENLAEFMKLEGSEHVLDLATGTGNAALAIARHLPQGKVTGIDLSSGMLSQARKKAEGMKNVEFMEMDLQHLDFPEKCFDAISCAFGIFFLEDMEAALKHVSTRVRKGGRIAMCGFAEGSFEPNAGLLYDALEHYGVKRPELPWMRLGTEEKWRNLFGSAGLENIEISRCDCGYFLESGRDWWELVWNAGFRGHVEQIPEKLFETFRHDHLDEIGKLATKEGIRLKVEVIYALGFVP